MTRINDKKLKCWDMTTSYTSTHYLKLLTQTLTFHYLLDIVQFWVGGDLEGVIGLHSLYQRQSDALCVEHD